MPDPIVNQNQPAAAPAAPAASTPAPATQPNATVPQAANPAPTPEPAKAGFLEPDIKPAAPTAEEKKIAEANKEAPTVDGKVAEPAFDFKALKVPENFKLDEVRDKGVIEFLSAAKIPQAKAQELADWHVKGIQEALKSSEDAGMGQYRALQDQSINNIKSDQLLGGANFETSKAKAQLFFTKTLEKIPETHRAMVTDYFIKGGAQNLEPVIRFVLAASDSIREDRPSGLGNTSNPPAKAPARFGLEGIRAHLVQKEK